MQGRRSFLAGVGAAVAGLFGWLTGRRVRATDPDSIPGMSQALLFRRDPAGCFARISFEEAQPGDRCVLLGLNDVCLFQAVVFTLERFYRDENGQRCFESRHQFSLFDLPPSEEAQEAIQATITAEWNRHWQKRREAATITTERDRQGGSAEED